MTPWSPSARRYACGAAAQTRRGWRPGRGVTPRRPRPPAEMTAADLVGAAEGASEEEFAAETGAWLALREPGAAARELLDFGAVAGPAERMTAVTAVRRLGDAAEPD